MPGSGEQPHVVETFRPRLRWQEVKPVLHRNTSIRLAKDQDFRCRHVPSNCSQTCEPLSTAISPAGAGIQPRRGQHVRVLPFAGGGTMSRLRSLGKRELADEGAYQRRLKFHGRKASPEEWRRFSEERCRARFTRAKCC